jgi:hypothetical protein
MCCTPTRLLDVHSPDVLVNASSHDQISWAQISWAQISWGPIDWARSLHNSIADGRAHTPRRTSIGDGRAPTWTIGNVGPTRSR